MDARSKLLRIVKAAKGDNLERAERIFAGFNLTEPYTISGRTRQEILDEYKRERAEWQAAYDLAKSIKGGA